MTERRPYSRHGLNALKARLKLRGLHAIDRRSAAARALAAWRRELVEDLGGESAISAQERAILDLAAQTKLLLDSVDAWLMEQPTLVNARRRALLPVVLQRQQLADALARYMGQVGLKRRRREMPSLQTYLAEKYGGNSRQGGEESETNPLPSNRETSSQGGKQHPAHEGTAEHDHADRSAPGVRGAGSQAPNSGA
jgi:hypothetical protein